MHTILLSHDHQDTERVKRIFADTATQLDENPYIPSKQLTRLDIPDNVPALSGNVIENLQHFLDSAGFATVRVDNPKGPEPLILI